MEQHFYTNNGGFRYDDDGFCTECKKHASDDIHKADCHPDFNNIKNYQYQFYHPRKGWENISYGGIPCIRTYLEAKQNVTQFVKEHKNTKISEKNPLEIFDCEENLPWYRWLKIKATA